MKVAVAGDVMTGASVEAATSAVSVRVVVPTALLAVMFTENKPGSVGVPAMVAVPLPVDTKESPGTNAPDSVSVALGTALVVMEKLPAAPTANEALSPEVNAGGPSTSTVRIWVADGARPFEACSVSG